ncbi:MAG TPA: hypothetical protein VH092_06525 [Urbifossiella sp.]|nr:hypothetical protein [Urbifossiella sp.]
MQAVLTGPIVTDYVPVAKPPWAVYVFVIGLLAMVMPREVLPEFCLASVLVAGGSWVVNRIWGGGPDSPRDHPPPLAG